jgi:hypothetical protein
MSSREIQVGCYAGGRADESPRQVTIDGQPHTVARLFSESLEEEPSSRLWRRRFTLLTTDGLTLVVVQAADGKWYLEN